MAALVDNKNNSGKGSSSQTALVASRAPRRDEAVDVISDVASVLGAAATASASGAAGPAVLQFHLHRDVTHVNNTNNSGANGVDSTASAALRQRNGGARREVGLGAVVGQCCECGVSVINDGNNTSEYFVCSSACGAVLWHHECAQKRLGEVRNAKEIRHACDHCNHVLTIQRVFGGPSHFKSLDDAVAAAPRRSITLAWMLYVLATLHLLWPLQALLVLVRFVYYVLRYPVMALYVTPYFLGIAMKLLIYTHKVFANDARVAQSSGTSFSTYRFVWRDETGQAGIHSDGGFHYDIGHWVFGIVLQLIVIKVVVIGYVLWRAWGYFIGPCWRRARTAIVAQSTPLPPSRA